MKYTINPYAQIIRNKDKYEFYAPPQKSTTITTEISISEELLKKMLSEDGLTREDLICTIGEDKANFLIEHKIYLTSLKEDDTVFSRTSQFFEQHLSAEQQKQIAESNLLILGCGGIGSSIAWLFAGLGIKKMTIVDFDVVEISNLNRMFMFNIADVGRKKTEVIKEKLQGLYADMEITAVDAKIDSEASLNEICSKEKYALVIKALDSPSIFPVWLDSVCKKNKLRYIGGITLRDRVMVGPTYIPGVAEDGWSDIVRTDNSMEHIYGKVPSIGSMLFNVTDRVAMEAIKILIGNYDECEYRNSIFSENIFTGEKEVIRKKSSKFKDEGNRKSASLLNMLVMLGFGMYSSCNSTILPLLVMFSWCLPFCSYYGRKHILLQTFINSTIGSIFVSLFVLKSVGLNTMSFCLVSIVIASIISLSGLCINSIIIKLCGKRQ